MNAEQNSIREEALADEEPRYLRRQKPLEIRRRKFGSEKLAALSPLDVAGRRSAGRRTGWRTRRCASSCFLRACSWPSSTRSRLTGNRYVARDAIAEKFTPDLGKQRRAGSAEARRAALESLPWVAQASVERALPNRIRVEMTERTPVAFLRTANELGTGGCRRRHSRSAARGRFPFSGGQPARRDHAAPAIAPRACSFSWSS